MVTANGGNFWSTFYDEASFVDNIGTETRVADILAEDSLLQTFRSDDSPVLTEWLCEERNVRDLLLYLVREPKPDATHDEAHKFPFLVCELFSCEVRPLLEAVAKNESLLELLFSFVLEDGQKRPHPAESEDDPDAESSCNPVLAGYFSRLVCLLLNHFPGEVGIYVTARYDSLLQAFIQTMECRSILEVFTRIMTCRYPRKLETFPGARFLADVLKVAAGAAPGAAGEDHARNSDSTGEQAEAGTKTASDPRTSHRILQQVPYLLEDLIAAEGTQAANDSLKTPPVGGAGVMGAATANGEVGPSSPKSDGTSQNGQQPSLPVPMLHELIKFRPATLLYSDAEDVVSAGVTLCSTIFHACLEADECAEAEEDEVDQQEPKVVDQQLKLEQDGGNKMASPAKSVDYIGKGDLEGGQHDPSEPPEEGEGDGAAPAASPQPSPAEKMSPVEVAEKMMALEDPHDGHRMTEEKELSEEQKRDPLAGAKRAEELQESLREQPPPLRRLFAEFLRDFESCFEKIAARMKVLIQKADDDQAVEKQQELQEHQAPEQSEDLPPHDAAGRGPDCSRTRDEQSGRPLPASLYNVFELICLFTSFITAGAPLCTKRLPKLLQFGIPQTGIQLFFLKPWSSILHNNIVLLLKAILVSDAIDADRKAQFLVETEFFQKARKAVGVLPAAVLGGEEDEIENENDNDALDNHDGEHQVEEGALHVKKGVVGRSGSSEIARLLSEQRRSRETAFARPGFYPHLMEMLDEIVATLHFSVLQGVVERSQAEGVGTSHSCITDFEVCLSHLEWWKSVVAVTTSRCVSVSTAPNSPEGAMESGMLMLGEHHLVGQGDQHQHLPVENSSFPAKNIDSGMSLEEFFGAANKDMGGTGIGNTNIGGGAPSSETHSNVDSNPRENYDGRHSDPHDGRHSYPHDPRMTADGRDRGDRSDVLFLARVQQEPLRAPTQLSGSGTIRNFQDQEISGNQPSRSLAAADSANGNDVDPRPSGASGEAQAPPFLVPVASPPVVSPYAGLVMPSAGHSEQTTQHSHTTTIGSKSGTPPTSSSTSPRDLLLPSGDIDQIGEADAPKPEFAVVGAGLMVTGTLVSSPKGLRGSPRSGC